MVSWREKRRIKSFLSALCAELIVTGNDDTVIYKEIQTLSGMA